MHLLTGESPSWQIQPMLDAKMWLCWDLQGARVSTPPSRTLKVSRFQRTHENRPSEKKEGLI